MTDDMEDRLSEVLRDRAGAPLTAGDPVLAVQNRMRRRSRRRGIAVGSTAALCVAGIAIAATALAGNDTSSRPIGPAVISSNPPAVATATPSATPPASPASSPAASSPPSSAASPVIAPSSSPPNETLPPNVSSLALPVGYTFFGLSTAEGPLVLTGTVRSTDPNAPCVRTSVNPTPLGLDALATSSCDDPAPPGDHVSIDVGNPDAGSTDFATTVAIARTNPTTGAVTTGPIVMRLNDASNTHVMTVHGGGSLWIYDLDTTNGPEAIQVSATSGQVEDVVRTPALSKPVIAANSDGLWLGNSIEGGQVAGTLFHVAPGSHAVSTVVASQSDAVDWMVAGPGHVWVGMRPNTSTLLSLWRFDGPKATVAFHTPEPTLQAGPNFVVGDEQDGLWLTTLDPVLGATQPIDIHHLDVVRLDADNGKVTVEATLPPPLTQLAAASQTAQGQSAFFAGDYFLLQSPSVGGYTGFTQLREITPLP